MRREENQSIRLAKIFYKEAPEISRSQVRAKIEHEKIKKNVAVKDWRIEAKEKAQKETTLRLEKRRFERMKFLEGLSNEERKKLTVSN